MILSDDGSTIAWQRFVNGGRKAVTYAASSADGAVLGEKGPTAPHRLLDVSDDRVLLGGWKRTLQWRFTTDRSRTVVKKGANVADIEHDLLAFYTRDPYVGGCTKLVRLSDPSTTLWRSCDHRVWDISPDGTRLATIDLLSDGVGPGDVTIREIDGSAVARYGTGWFSSVEWESADTVLLGVNGRRGPPPCGARPRLRERDRSSADDVPSTPRVDPVTYASGSGAEHRERRGGGGQHRITGGRRPRGEQRLAEAAALAEAAVQGHHHLHSGVVVDVGEARDDSCRAHRQQGRRQAEELLGPHRLHHARLAGRQDHAVRGPAQPLEVVHQQRAVGQRERGEERAVLPEVTVGRDVRQRGAVQRFEGGLDGRCLAVEDEGVRILAATAGTSAPPESSPGPTSITRRSPGRGRVARERNHSRADGVLLTGRSTNTGSNPQGTPWSCAVPDTITREYGRRSAAGPSSARCTAPQPRRAGPAAPGGPAQREHGEVQGGGGAAALPTAWRRTRPSPATSACR